MDLLARAYLKFVILRVRDQDNIFLARRFESIRQYGFKNSYVESDNILVFQWHFKHNPTYLLLLRTRLYVCMFWLKQLPEDWNPSS